MVCFGKYCYFFLKKNKEFYVKLYKHKRFDITNKKDVYQIISKNDYIINCAAYTNVDKAESNSILCNEINGNALNYLAYEINKQRKKLIHISSDFVYGNIHNKNNYEELFEDDILNPINVYRKF